MDSIASSGADTAGITGSGEIKKYLMYNIETNVNHLQAGYRQDKTRCTGRPYSRVSKARHRIAELFLPAVLVLYCNTLNIYKSALPALGLVRFFKLTEIVQKIVIVVFFT